MAYSLDHSDALSRSSTHSMDHDNQNCLMVSCRDNRSLCYLPLLDVCLRLLCLEFQSFIYAPCSNKIGMFAINLSNCGLDRQKGIDFNAVKMFSRK